MAPRTPEYGSIKITHTESGSEDEEQPLTPDNHNGDGMKRFESGTASEGKTWRNVIAVSSVVAVILVVISVQRGGAGASSGSGSASSWSDSHSSKPSSSSSSSMASSLTYYKKSPEKDLGLQGLHREEDATPSAIWGEKAKEGPLPTNSWYLNLVSHRASAQPDDATRAYTVPYIIDTAAGAFSMPFAGIRVHWPVIQASANNVQMVNDARNGIVVGTKTIDTSKKTSTGFAYNSYEVDQENDLSLVGVSLRWNSNLTKTDNMLTHIVRGMPYATMKYEGNVEPTIYSYNGPKSKPVIDNSKLEMDCGLLKESMDISGAKTYTVNKELKLHFINSDFTWLVFFNQPVKVQCGVTEGDEKVAQFLLTIQKTSEESPLVVRSALISSCTSGESNIHQHCYDEEKIKDDKEGFTAMLRNYSDVIATHPRVDLTYSDKEGQNASINFDWAPVSMKKESSLDDLLMYALPHHQEQLDTTTAEISKHCVPTFHGSTCLVKGSKWSIKEDLSRPQSFTARRPPEASAIPTLAKALAQDIHYQMGDNMLRGAGDTYFTAKILGRMARTIVLADEMKALASASSTSSLSKFKYDDVTELDLQSILDAAKSVSTTLPSDKDVVQAIELLKRAITVWLDGAEAPFLYDRSWGGLVNCGCRYSGKEDKGFCNNTFPDCPALIDVNEDFGNGYYNDHHYHYGYNVYAAAVAAKYDPDWGKQYFDKVLLYVRDFASPLESDQYFTPFRNKDWWLGSSWASGIVSAENSPHGRNEESSSEAIAAYEGMALYGQVMADIFEQEGKVYERGAAMLIRDAGELLTITEVEATNRYWHVWSSATHNSTYPTGYQQHVVGMLYDTMATFQTWFSQFPLVSYGIQIMPFTAVGEIRDDPQWAAEVCPIYQESCEQAGKFCIENGWSIVQAGICGTGGDHKLAIDQALSIPPKVFDSQGGSGNSLSNTIWYIATRKPYNNATNTTN